MKKRNLILILFILLLLLIFSGCWSNEDLARLAVASAVGVDKTTDNQIEVSVQIIKPSAMSSGISEGSGGSDKKGYFVVSNKGRTIFEAIRNVLSVVDRRIFYSEAQVIVIGEDFARQGIGDIMDFFIRERETKPNIDIAIAKGSKAKEILETSSEIEQVPAIGIMETLNNQEIRASIKRTVLLDVVNDLNSEGRDIVIGTITREGKEKLLIRDSAVFKKGKLVGWMDRAQTRGFNFLKAPLKSSLITVPNPDMPDKEITIEISRIHSKLGVKWENELSPIS